MRKFLLFLLCIIISCSTTPVRALEVAATPTTEFLPTAPLLITGYQTSSAALNLAVVEVYNTSDNPVDLTNWAMQVVLKDTTTKAVQVLSRHTGWLLPGEHVVYSTEPATTFGLALSQQVSAIVTVELRYIGTDQVYKPVTAAVAATTDAPFFRSYTTTGYGAAFATSATPRPFYDDGLYVAPASVEGLRIVEIYPYGSDCAPDDTGVLCGDYMKLTNVSGNNIALDDLVLRTDSSSASRTSSNSFTLAGLLKPGEFLAVSKTDAGMHISLTNSGGYVWLEDAWGMKQYSDTMTKYESAGTAEQGYAYALTSQNTWAWTTTPQPGGENTITAPVVVIAECTEGKYRNPDTGRCRTIEEAVNALSVCEEGYERNAVTNRCRKIAVLATASLTPCLEGQERNPQTNRCRSIASAVAELLPCEEGYERNAETHRCRKASTDSMPEVAFPVTPVQPLASDMAGWWAFGAVLTLALGYGAWEWRVELAGIARRSIGLFARNK